jgi:hypothetical protein
MVLLVLGSGVALAVTIVGTNGNDTIFADDNSTDDIDCGVYASPTDSAGDSDTVYADRVSDGDPVSDILSNCETVN